MLDLTQSWDDIAAFLSLLAEVLRPGGDVAEVLGPGDDEAAFLGRVCAGENHGEGSPLVFAPENCEAPFRRGDYLARKRLGFHSLLAEVLGPGDDEAAFLSLLARVLGPGDDEAAFLSLLARVLGPGDDEAAFLSLLAEVLRPGVTLPRFSDLGMMKPLFSAAFVQERITERGRLWYLHLRTVRPPLDAATISHERGSGFTVSLPRFSDLGMMKPLFSVSLPGFSAWG